MKKLVASADFGGSKLMTDCAHDFQYNIELRI